MRGRSQGGVLPLRDDQPPAAQVLRRVRRGPLLSFPEPDTAPSGCGRAAIRVCPVRRSGGIHHVFGGTRSRRGQGAAHSLLRPGTRNRGALRGSGRQVHRRCRHRFLGGHPRPGRRHRAGGAGRPGTGPLGERAGRRARSARPPTEGRGPVGRDLGRAGRKRHRTRGGRHRQHRGPSPVGCLTRNGPGGGIHQDAHRASHPVRAGRGQGSEGQISSGDCLAGDARRRGGGREGAQPRPGGAVRRPAGWSPSRNGATSRRR